MAKGIVTKIWNVSSGKGSRTSSKQINDSIDYILNTEKCSEKLEDDMPCQLGRELNYVTNDVKTLEGLYTGGRHILNLDCATEEMLQMKEYYGKLDGRIALHGMISLDTEESNKQNAGKLMLLCDELMREVFGDHQVVYAVHTNTEHLHVHFIVNTVGMSGKKIHMDHNFMKKVFQPTVNRLASKYGFTENENWKKEESKDVLPIVERKIFLRNKIDLAIEESEDFREFLEVLSNMGVDCNVGKYLSMKTEDMPKAMRSFRLGENYTVDSIKERILHKRDDLTWLEMNTYVQNIPNRQMTLYVPSVLKKYKDMSEKEKGDAVRLLRLGKNPWKMNSDNNWQINKSARELSMAALTHDIVRFYSPDAMSIESAKEEIKSYQKKIREERKAIKENLKKNKPILDLYKEMQQYELPAFLYDVDGRMEFEEQYETYKKLSERLERAYGKTIDEVAAYYENEKNELLYSKAQEEELNEQYKSLLRYEKRMEQKNQPKTNLTFFDAVGHYKAKQEAKMGLISTRLVYITAEESTDVIIMVKTTPAVVDGKPSVETEVTVIDENGKEIESVSSKGHSVREFNKKLLDIKERYNMNRCQVNKDTPILLKKGSRH